MAAPTPMMQQYLRIKAEHPDKAELIAHALSEEQLPASRVVMVGDRWHDMVGARSCGVYPLGVSYGYGTEDELRSHGAAAIADNPDSIPPLIRDQNTQMLCVALDHCLGRGS
jgi:phosphoglycolate phosphatase-like HAD superfamily hydrolase